VTAERLIVTDRRTLSVHPQSGAETQVFTITRCDRNRPFALAEALDRANDPRARLLVNSQSRRAAVQMLAPNLMLDDGEVERRGVRLFRPMAWRSPRSHRYESGAGPPTRCARRSAIIPQPATVETGAGPVRTGANSRRIARICTASVCDGAADYGHDCGMYLRTRGITALHGGGALRFHPRCYYRADADAPTETWPALIAAVTDRQNYRRTSHLARSLGQG
jgi:hypothetical protein